MVHQRSYGYSAKFNSIRPSKEIVEYYEVDEEAKKYKTFTITSTSDTAQSNTAKIGNGYAKLTYMSDTDDMLPDLKQYNGTTLQYIGIMPKNTMLAEYVKNVDFLNMVSEMVTSQYNTILKEQQVWKQCLKTVQV